MKWAPSILVLAICFLLTACGGVSRVNIVLDGEPEGHGVALVQTTVSDPHAFAPTTQRSWIERCLYVRQGRLEDYPKFIYQNCVRDGEVQFSTASGYIAGLAGPLLYSAAGAYAGHEIGRGLGQSGSQTSNSTTNSTTSTQSVTVPGGKPGHK